MNILEKTIRKATGNYDNIKWRCKTIIEKYNDGNTNKKPDEVRKVNDNLLVNTGIAQIIKLLIGDSSAKKLDTQNTYIGVGNSSSEEKVDQAGLLGSQKCYKQMVNDEHTYPHQSGDNIIEFRTSYGADEANFAWQEYGLFSGNPQSSLSAVMFNRKVSSLGTKPSGATWIIRMSIYIG